MFSPQLRHHIKQKQSGKGASTSTKRSHFLIGFAKISQVTAVVAWGVRNGPRTGSTATHYRPPDILSSAQNTSTTSAINIIMKLSCPLAKLFLIEDRDQTNRVTAIRCVYALVLVAAAGLRRTTLHASPR